MDMSFIFVFAFSKPLQRRRPSLWCVYFRPPSKVMDANNWVSFQCSRHTTTINRKYPITNHNKQNNNNFRYAERQWSVKHHWIGFARLQRWPSLRDRTTALWVLYPFLVHPLRTVLDSSALLFMAWPENRMRRRKILLDCLIVLIMMGKFREIERARETFFATTWTKILRTTFSRGR